MTDCAHCTHPECQALGCAEHRFYEAFDELITCWAEMRAEGRQPKYEYKAKKEFGVW